MRTSRSLSARMTALGGAVALAAAGLVGAIGLVATSTPAGATTTPLGPSTCNILVGSTTEPTVITPTVTADITPSPVPAAGSFSLSTLSLSSVLDPNANPTLVQVAGDTLAITFKSTLSATGATPTSQAVTFTGQIAIPKPFNTPATVILNGSTGGYTADGSGTTSAAVLLSGTGSLVASVVGTSLPPFTGPCTGSAATQIASVAVVPPAAFVTNVIPNAGVIAGGTKVKLVGQNLAGAKTVDFGTEAATSFQVLSPNVIEAVAPAITTNGSTTQTPVAVKVTTTAGPPTLSPTDTFTYVDPTLGTIVSSVSPRSGSSAGGNGVLITGIGFNDPDGGPATAVMFGSVNQPNFTVVSDNVITTTAPPGTGVVNVTVIGNDGSTPSVLSPADRYNYAPGYFLTGSDGGVFSYGQTPGQANFYGSAGGLVLNKPVVGMAVTPDGGGYWLVASDGGVFAYGDATFYGSLGNVTLNKPIVGIAASPDGAGYWLVAADGGVFGFGDALFYGSTGNITLNKPVVGIAPTADGAGYYLVASDGGVFAYGDATFAGSAGGLVLAKPVTGIALNPAGSGYYLVGSDGGVFAYGDALFHGSLSGTALAAPVTAIAATPDGGGYWLTTASGAVFNQGDAGFYGDVAGVRLNAPIVGFASSLSAEPAV
jgi:IPT/TIG domain